MLAGGFTGLIVYVGIVLFFYFVLRAKVQGWWDASLNISSTILHLYWISLALKLHQVWDNY
jgi:hypothetical protein